MTQDILLIETARPGAKGDLDAGAVEWTTMRADVDALLARPAITALGSIPDVDTGGVADGETLVYDSAANGGLGGYVAGAPSGAIGAVDGMVDVTTLSTGAGLTSSEVSAGQAELAVQFGGTGSAAAAARSDHAHLTSIMHVYPYTATGLLSSGSRQVAVGNVVVPAGVPCLIKAAFRSTVRGGGASSSYYHMWVAIDGNANPSEEMQAVGGVPDKVTFERGKQVTGDGTATAIAAAIAYSSGDAADVRAGELVVTLVPAK